MNRIKTQLLFTLALLLVGFTACNEEPKEDKKPLIVCTTGMLTDAVKELVDTHATVIGLMGPGVDPHLYKATQGDIQSLSQSDIIVYNGLHLEGKMGEIFEKLAQRKKIIIAADGVDQKNLINNTDFQGAYDPHLWFDVQLWNKVFLHIGHELQQLPKLPKDYIQQCMLNYQDSLLQLDEWVKLQLNSIDSSKRILVTAHDAFGYFGQAYNIKVKALQGISTQAEFGLKDVSDLVNFITENQIKAVFVESSVSERSLNAVVEGCLANNHKVKIGGSLFSDAMGPIDAPTGTYLGMVKHNVKTIVKGLK